MALLFYSASVFDVMESQKQLLREKLHELPISDLGDSQVPERLANEYGMDVPVLYEEKKYAKKRQTQVDVSRDPSHFFFGDGPRSMPGTELSIFVPFSGDPALFNVKPTSYDLNPPVADVVANELCFVYRFVNAPNLDEYQRTLEKVKRYLDWLRPSAAQLKTELLSLAQNVIARRKQQAADHARILDSLGIPIRDDQPSRPAAPAAPAPTKPVRRYRARKSEDAAWDVFVCHATEDKAQIAGPLATELRAKGLRVWYDEFSLKLGDSLRESIDRGLSRSRFGVVILSPNFFEKRWPQKELNGLVTREADGSIVILPVWHNVGFDEVRHQSPTLADRFAVSTTEGLDKVSAKIMEAMR